MIDWGEGEYEHTAVELMPAAEHIVALAAPAAGEHLLDVGCGTGNAAAVAAAASAVVTGVDPAQRLLEVAAARVPAATFVRGSAEELPFDAESFDVVVSVFGLIFAADGRAAAREVLRVLKPGGRALISAWRPEGAIHEAVASLMAAMGAPPPAPDRLEWGEPERARPDLEALGADLSVHDATLVFTQPSAEAWMASNEQHHPLAIMGRRALAAAGRHEEARARAVQILERHNEDERAWKATSRYVIYELRRR